MFPRTAELPTHSPQYWVQQKDRFLRQLLIRDIEAITKRRLVVYFANRYAPDSDIQAIDIANLNEVLDDVGTEPVDLFVETNGGQTDTTEALVSLLLNVVGDLRVIVANAAKSNGTLLALAARSIVMGVTSELGPIEPSLNNIPASILDSDEVKKTNFVLHRLGQYALKQSRDLATKLLGDGMMKGKPQDQIKDAVDALATRDRFASHGSVVDHKEAASLGLKVDYLPPTDDLWRCLWLLYCMYDYDCRKGNYLKIFEGRARSLSIAGKAPSPPTSPGASA